MIQKAFSIRDSKAEVYFSPFYQKTTGEAERSFAQLVNDPQTMVGKFPEDYDLYLIGEWNDQTGLLTPLDTPLHVMNGISVPKRNANRGVSLVNPAN